jgi:hypothetical protein
MTLARLVVAVLMICSLLAFAQDQQSQSSQTSASSCRESRTGCRLPGNVQFAGGEFFFFDLSHYKAATPAEQWRLFPDRPADIPSGYNALDPSQLDQHRLDEIKSDLQLRVARQWDELNEDSICYAIRSYVVARDSKDSDSTHPAGYSTCQPSNRYQVKTADMRVVSGDR